MDYVYFPSMGVAEGGEGVQIVAIYQDVVGIMLGFRVTHNSTLFVESTSKCKISQSFYKTLVWC